MHNRHSVERRARPRLVIACALALIVVGCQDSSAPGTDQATRSHSRMAASSRLEADEPVSLEMFAPGDGDHAGVNGVGWFVDIDLEFEGGLEGTGFIKNQLTGPGVHQNAAPFPGAAAPGKDDAFPGLVVLISTATFGARSCQNLANLFNITGPTVVTPEETEIWDTWIITAPNFGRNTDSRIFVAEVKDLDHDGIHNDAPDVVADVNNDGKCTGDDLRAIGLDSKIVTAHFFIN